MRARNGDPSAPYSSTYFARAIPSKTSARFCKILSSLFSHLISFIQNLHPVADTQRPPLLVGHRARRSQARRVDANPLVPLGIRTGNGRGGGTRLSSEHQHTHPNTYCHAHAICLHIGCEVHNRLCSRESVSHLLEGGLVGS